MTMRTPACAWLMLLMAACGDARAQSPSSFGRAGAQPIQWEAAAGTEVSSNALRLTQPGATARSSELQLAPLQLYQLTTTMARGPFCAPRFAITYVDAHATPQTWIPHWQFPDAARADGQPLSPHPQRYVQGFVLPPGASHPRIQLQLDGPDKRELARYARWELLALQLEPVQSIRCCERVENDRLLGGDLELAASAEFPLGWTQWGLDANNRLEWVALPDDPAHKHVLRAKPHTIAVLASTQPVSVTRGGAFRIAAQVRGRGKLELFAISLNDDAPVPVRVGNSGRASFDIRDDNWSMRNTLWFAEAPNIASAQVVAVLAPETSLEIDALELRPFD